MEFLSTSFITNTHPMSCQDKSISGVTPPLPHTPSQRAQSNYMFLTQDPCTVCTYRYQHDITTAQLYRCIYFHHKPSIKIQQSPLLSFLMWYKVKKKGYDIKFKRNGSHRRTQQGRNSFRKLRRKKKRRGGIMGIPRNM